MHESERKIFLFSSQSWDQKKEVLVPVSRVELGFLSHTDIGSMSRYWISLRHLITMMCFCSAFFLESRLDNISLVSSDGSSLQYHTCANLNIEFSLNIALVHPCFTMQPFSNVAHVARHPCYYFHSSTFTRWTIFRLPWQLYTFKCTINRTFDRANPEYGNTRCQFFWGVQRTLFWSN